MRGQEAVAEGETGACGVVREVASIQMIQKSKGVDDLIRSDGRVRGDAEERERGGGRNYSEAWLCVAKTH